MPLPAFTSQSVSTRAMTLVAMLAVTLVPLLGGGGVLAQFKVRTETIRPAAGASPPPSATQFVPPGQEASADLAHPPAAVLRTRERILAAARTGDLQALLAVMQANGSMPVFSHTQRQDPVAYWRENYPDSEGIEILSILITLLETAPVRIDANTPREMYLWPYFARLPLRSLTPAQKVDLFRVVTGSDYREMLERGRYVFYQVGIGPDGMWRYFIASE
jgi:hypothetical protein